MAQDVLSTYQVANICKVHHTTVIKWMNDGVLTGYTTPGGHRRVYIHDVLDFMKKYKIPIPQEIQKGTQRILIVDDDIEFLEELREALNHKDFEIDCALNGFEAGRKIYSKKPDLLLLDFKMPGMDGFQVCDVLRKDQDTCSIPIVAVTSMTSQEDIEKIKEAGVKQYLPKPLDIMKLKKIINNILEVGNED